MLAAWPAARPRLAARAGARRARIERPPRVTMQSNASGHKVVNISIHNALLSNLTELSTNMPNEKPSMPTVITTAPIAAARSRIKKNRTRAAPAPCPPCTNRPHRTAPHRTVPCRAVPPLSRSPQSRSRDSNPGPTILKPIL